LLTTSARWPIKGSEEFALFILKEKTGELPLELLADDFFQNSFDFLPVLTSHLKNFKPKNPLNF